jgi:hypothetical protein
MMSSVATVRSQGRGRHSRAEGSLRIERASREVEHSRVRVSEVFGKSTILPLAN